MSCVVYITYFNTFYLMPGTCYKLYIMRCLDLFKSNFALNIQLLSKFFIDSDFVIIIYIPYTCLRVCYKHMLCLMYDFFLTLHERYI